MQKLLRKALPWQIHWRGVLLESALFLAIYIAWLVLCSPQSSGRLFIGSLAVLIPGAAATLLILRFLPHYPSAARPAWRFLGLGMTCWALANLVRSMYEAAGGMPVPIFSLADILSFMAYPLFFFALIWYPFENRYAPSRFLFLLDVSISSGVVAMLVWLMLGRSASALQPAAWVPFVYPIADLILLMILLNMLLANRKARQTLFLWGCGLFSFLVSDYIYSLLAPLNGYQSGGAESLGWMIGGLIFGWGAVFMGSRSYDDAHSQEEPPGFDLGMRLQNILPFAFVLALGWFVLADWRLSGRVSWIGAGVSLFLALALVVRMGVRAGEIELHRYWQLFSSLAEPVFICDGAGKILLANPALVRALGLRDARQVTGKPLASILEDQTIPADWLASAARQECSLEVRLRSQLIPYNLSLSPIFSEGRQVLLAGAAHDLRGQKRQQAAIQLGFDELQVVHRQLKDLNAQLEQKVEERTQNLTEALRQLEEQNKKLQELDQLKSDFISMVSHELRTPLTSLNGGLELLLLQKGRPAPDRSTLTLMKEEVRRLTRFVENILNLSATQAGRMRLNLQPVSLATIIQTVCNTFGGAYASGQIQVRLADALPLVMADEGFLQSIFNHLIDNALKYAHASPVVVEARLVKNRVRVQVTDGGLGIPEAKRRLLFQRFQRLDAKDSQSVYGYGLGLYLSRLMLRAMRSDLAFEAPPEGGARFYFNLKAAR